VSVLAKVLSALMAFLLSGSNIVNSGGKAVLEYDKYTREAYMTPVWEGDTVYNETLMFVADKNGNVPPAPLLYTPTEVLSVRSFDLKTEYTPGVDYTVENGCIMLTENSRIYKWSYLDYYPAAAIPGRTFDKTGGGFLSFGEGDTYYKTQVAVTYRHADTWKGIIPRYKGDVLKNTVAKLENGEKLTIVYYGDSITTGANSSNLNAPYAPIWTQLVTQTLAAKFNDPNITEINTAVGGTNAAWGADNVKDRVIAYNPDLVVIAFGMNDAKTCKLKYGYEIGKIIREVRKANKNAEFILVSPMHPNKEANGFYGNQKQFERVLNKIAGFRSGVAVAPVWSMHSAILEHKRYYDMTGNNVNHPNDFMARIYAQTVAALLLEGVK